jgi:rapamycin-insensitive companion of mTOR
MNGQEELDNLGWVICNGICVPKHTHSFFNLNSWEFQGSWPTKRAMTFTPIPYRLDEDEEEILKCIGNLSNHIVASANSKRLGQ